MAVRVTECVGFNFPLDTS